MELINFEDEVLVIHKLEKTIDQIPIGIPFGLIDHHNNDEIRFIGCKIGCIKDTNFNAVCLWIHPERIGNNNSFIQPGELTIVSNKQVIYNINKYDLYFNG